jgi:hypothetical protein
VNILKIVRLVFERKIILFLDALAKGPYFGARIYIFTEHKIIIKDPLNMEYE